MDFTQKPQSRAAATIRKPPSLKSGKRIQKFRAKTASFSPAFFKRREYIPLNLPFPSSPTISINLRERYRGVIIRQRNKISKCSSPRGREKRSHALHRFRGLIARICAYGKQTGHELPVPFYQRDYDNIEKRFHALRDLEDLFPYMVACKIRWNGKDSIVSIGGKTGGK